LSSNNNYKKVVAIHQPNYIPWLGYFHKVFRADVFVFLDDVQHSKNSFINRTKIMGQDNKSRWLTIPVSFKLGDRINEVFPSFEDWPSKHIDNLRGHYRKAPHFKYVWEDIINLYGDIKPSWNLDKINIHLIRRICEMLRFDTEFVPSSSLEHQGEADDRLVCIVSSISSKGSYLSGKGGAKYQDPQKFFMAGLGFEYTSFEHSEYPQWSGDFQNGLSIFDAVFHLGWENTAEIVISEK